MAGPTVLVIEDDFAIGEFLKDLLPQRGYQVLHAPDGRSGLELARKHRPQVILLDIMLPFVNGLEVCRQLKNDPATRGIKIVMMTALGRMSDVETAFSAGASDYLIKPCDAAKIFDKLQKVLSK